ncbi:MAG: hypothetical protein LBM71_05515, partial [Elusimicrobiota bacterium]|nr:hypothetical protein [Elusimicrobiota bacterium]
LAQAAFDGSKGATAGIELSGTNVAASANQGLEGVASTLDMPKFELSAIDNTYNNFAAAKDIRSQIWGNLAAAALTVVGAVVAIVALMKASNWFSWVAAGLAAAAALYAVWNPDTFKLLNQLSAIDKAGGDNATFMWGITITIQTLLTAAVGAAFYFGIKASQAAKLAQSQVASKQTGDATSGQFDDVYNPQDALNKANSSPMADKVPVSKPTMPATPTTPSTGGIDTYGLAGTAKGGADMLSGWVKSTYGGDGSGFGGSSNTSTPTIKQSGGGANNSLNSVNYDIGPGSGSGSGNTAGVSPDVAQNAPTQQPAQPTTPAGGNPYTPGTEEWAIWNAEHPTI